MKQNVIVDKSFNFSLCIIDLHFSLNRKKAFVISKQIMRSGTSVGANVEEAQGAVSSKDFRHKLSLAYKEARETMYWLKIINYHPFFEDIEISEIIELNVEILKLLTSILKSCKSKL